MTIEACMALHGCLRRALAAMTVLSLGLAAPVAGAEKLAWPDLEAIADAARQHPRGVAYVSVMPERLAACREASRPYGELGNLSGGVAVSDIYRTCLETMASTLAAGLPRRAFGAVGLDVRLQEAEQAVLAFYRGIYLGSPYAFEHPTGYDSYLGAQWAVVEFLRRFVEDMALYHGAIADRQQWLRDWRAAWGDSD
jgi:hypothetical protein